MGLLETEYALCVNVSCLSCELNRVEIEPYCLELAEKNMLLPIIVVFFTLKSFI